MMTSNNRKISIIELNVDTEADQLMAQCQRALSNSEIHAVLLRIDARKTIDIGSLCYGVRSTGKSPKKVQYDTIIPHRQIPLRNLASGAITYGLTKSPDSAGAKLTNFLTMLNWAETAGHTNFLLSPEAYHSALTDFTEHLTQSKRQPNTKSHLQTDAVETGNWIFPNSPVSFREGMPYLATGASSNPSAATPDAAKISIFLNTLHPLFTELSNFLLKQLPFPYPATLNSQPVMLGTHAYPFLTQLALFHKSLEGTLSHTADYATGYWRSFEEVRSLFPKKDEKIYTKFVADQTRKLENANQDMRCSERVRLAVLAHDAFLGLFATASGLNEQPILDLPWTGNFEVIKGSEGERILTVVKNRGGPRIVSFTVHAAFLNPFNLYLRLREYILAGQPHPYLFIGQHAAGFRLSTKARRVSLINLCRRIRLLIDPSFQIISYRQLRRYKDSFIISNYGIKQAARSLQHSEEVHRSNYSSIHEKDAVDQMVAALTDLVSTFNSDGKFGVPAGGCATPTPTIATASPIEYQPDCKNQMGCIFCMNFRITTDYLSITKLLSLEYIIRQRIHSCDSFEHFNKNHEPALIRIQKIFEELLRIHPEAKEIYDQAHGDIYERQQLHSYWLRYLERNVKLGLMR